MSGFAIFLHVSLTIYSLQYAYLPKLPLPEVPVDKRLQIEEMGKFKWGKKKIKLALQLLTTWSSWKPTCPMDGDFTEGSSIRATNPVHQH